jgi:hypothetical protein
LAGRTDDALALVSTVVPIDAYEWTHVFECVLRLGRLDAIDMHSFLYRPPQAGGHRWAELARMRMRADYLRLANNSGDLEPRYEELLDAYDRAGMPLERCLTRLSWIRWLMRHGDRKRASEANAVVLDLAERFGMCILRVESWMLVAELADDQAERERGKAEATRLRQACGFWGPARP